MDSFRFELEPPAWTQTARHAKEFCCPACQAQASAAQRVWLNRHAPVYTPDQNRKWQEFYQCECGQAWWAWSSDRPPSNFRSPDFNSPNANSPDANSPDEA